MQAAQRSHRFIDPLVNACVLTLGLYIATVPVAPSSSKGMEQAIDAARPLQSTPPPIQKPPKPFYVAEANGQIVGFAMLASNGYIDCFYCHHNYQQQRIGSQLFASPRNDRTRVRNPATLF